MEVAKNCENPEHVVVRGTVTRISPVAETFFALFWSLRGIFQVLAIGFASKSGASARLFFFKCIAWPQVFRKRLPRYSQGNKNQVPHIIPFLSQEANLM